MALFPHSFRTLVCFLLALLSCANHATARETKYITGTDVDGVSRQLAADRYPALYTGDFGDCLGGQSLFNITKFDAAYYRDNLTVLFHLDGTSSVRQEDLMLHFSVEAYGEERFQMTFNPCLVNVDSLCPLNASKPIETWVVFPVGPTQVSGIPAIALEIPDFEGSAKLQIFANSSRTQIGCFQAVMRNGKTFSHPKAVSSVLGVFTIAAIGASLAAAAYGVSIPHMRTHYAHSLSILAIFEVFQSIFFLGALSVEWPSVLVAWWSNFAWAGGLIYSSGMIDSVDSFVGVTGNASQVGGAGSTTINTGGGLVSQIYGRALENVAPAITKRAAYNESNPYDYTWAGKPVLPGMPLPGSWHGFAGTLTGINVPAPDAFLIGLIWTLIGAAIIAFGLIAFKFALEGTARMKWIQQNRLEYFRSHWIGYLKLAMLRTFLVTFFSLMTLCIFQFATHDSKGATAIAAVVFIIVLLGVVGVVGYGCYMRLRAGNYSIQPDRILLQHTTMFGSVPCILPIRSSTLKERELEAKPLGSMPFFRICYTDDDPGRTTVHQDEAYVKRFGWLSARYRRTKWWFLACWVVYQFVRACFLGAGVNTPLAQVYGFFIFEILAFVALVKLDPFEGRRNTAIAVWLLGMSKIITAGLSIAFLPDFNLDRIIATVIGVIIIIVQAFLVIALLILVVLGVISSWMSLTRNREDFSPESLENVRLRYFEHLIAAAPDKALPKQPRIKRIKKLLRPEPMSPPQPVEPQFAVTKVRRAPKIEDEDGDHITEMAAGNSAAPFPSLPTTRRSRTNSMNSRYSVGSLPRGARAHRTSWSSKDFSQWDSQFERPNTALTNRASMGHANTPSTSTAPLVQKDMSRSNLRITTNASQEAIGSGSLTPIDSPRLTPTKEAQAEHADERTGLAQ